ncbi:hypothetical protein ENSA5_32160 [Enhygromyxa salina]|uniref:Cyclic nucleotide-binding domain-containing protein n=2 Tax=Enhygromyxa salina TaxID=215803 RepID=A0A2S9XXV8_9BACT|nr:hypothetical protein ENSA5_32160 [Enhygromyxa salina]
MLSGLTADALEPLGQALTLVRHDDGARLFYDEVPNRDAPLRILVHGHATWDPAHSSDDNGAWTLTTGSVFGLGAVNDWAAEAGLDRTWPRADLPMIRCRAKGPISTLELAPDRFEAVFMSKPGGVLRDRLLAMFPTVVHGGEIVAALRATPQFSRVNAVALYRLLDLAPTVTYQPTAKDPDQPQQPAAPPPGLAVAPGPALYYVLRGQLQLVVDETLLSFGAGEVGGSDLFADEGAATLKAATATTKATAVVVTKEAVAALSGYMPGFARSLGPMFNGQRVKP